MAVTDQPSPIIALRSVAKVFGNATVALEDFDLSVRAGEFLSLLGPSGCGKSTALRLIAGLAEPSRGSVERRGEASGRQIGFVFQDPTLMPWASLFDNVYLPLRLEGVRRSVAAPTVSRALAAVGLGEFSHAYPHELSGGMRMRVSLARALVTAPGVLLMDEPFAALDEITRFRLNDDLLALWLAVRRTVIFVTHSVFESVYLSNRIVVLTGRPGRVFTELVIDAPYPRDARFRTSPEYAAFCRQTSQALANAMAAKSAMIATSPGGRHERERREAWLRIVLPGITLSLAAVGWQLVVVGLAIPPYVLPGPVLVVQTLIADWGVLSTSLLATLATTLQGLFLATAGGVVLAVIFNQSRIFEYALYPYAVILQVTPVVAIAPLLLIWLPQHAAVLVCAWIVAFFPMLANTTLGLNSVDHNLLDLFALYHASRWQVLRHLKLPAALPHMMAGLRIAGGLSLVGAVVAEIAAGSAGAGSGLAYRIAESGYRLNIPRMFAALLLLAIAGIVIYLTMSVCSHLVLRRWHESAVGREA